SPAHRLPAPASTGVPSTPAIAPPTPVHGLCGSPFGQSQSVSVSLSSVNVPSTGPRPKPPPGSVNGAPPPNSRNHVKNGSPSSGATCPLSASVSITAVKVPVPDQPSTSLDTPATPVGSQKFANIDHGPCCWHSNVAS